MKVLYILGEYPSNTEYFIKNEIEDLRKLGLEIDIISLTGSQLNHISNIFYEKKIKALLLFIKSIHRIVYAYSLYKKLSIISSKDILRKLNDLKSALFFSKVIDLSSYDHIHAHFANRPTDIGYLLAQMSNRSFSFTAHANDIYCNSISDLTNKISIADFVITCTKYNQKYLNGICKYDLDKQKIHQIYHGIRLSDWVIKSDLEINLNSGLNLLTIGRLIPKKGIVYLLETMVGLKKVFKNIKLTIIGDGPEISNLRNFCLNNDLCNEVIFIGFLPQTELNPYYKNADIFILPSIIDKNNDRDGLPNVIIEAMASGVPVISTNISAIPEVIIHKFSGMIIPSEDPKSIYDSVIFLVENSNERNIIIKESASIVINLFESIHNSKKIIELFLNH